jgi:hypothetical protein
VALTVLAAVLTSKAAKALLKKLEENFMEKEGLNINCL